MTHNKGKTALALAVAAASAFSLPKLSYAQDVALEEILVTARKRQESLQDASSPFAV